MRGRWFQVVAAAMFINTSYGTLSYSFTVLVTREAAGGELGPATVSVAFGAALLVSGVVALLAGTIADVVGSRRLMAAGSVAGAAGLWLLGWSTAAWQALLVMSLLVGPAMAATFYEPVYVLMNRWFAPAERPRAYGVLTLVSGFSITIFTPLTSVLVEEFGWRAAVRVLAAILLAVGVAVPTVLLSEPRLPAARPSVASLLRDTARGLRHGSTAFWLFTGAFFLANLAFSGFSFHAVALFESRGFRASDVANVIALAGVLSLPARLVLPAMSGRAPAASLLAVCIGLLAVAAALAGVAGQWWQVWAYVVVFGAVFGALYPLRALVTSERFAGEFYGRLLGTQALFLALSRATGPALIGLYLGWGGSYRTAFLAAAALLAGSAVAMLAALRERPAPFAPLPITRG